MKNNDEENQTMKKYRKQKLNYTVLNAETITVGGNMFLNISENVALFC